MPPINVLLLQPEQAESVQVADLVSRALERVSSKAIVTTIPGLQYVFKANQQSIVDAVERADVVVGNLNGGNASVTFGLTAALSLSKPIVLIAPTNRALSVPDELSAVRPHFFSLNQPDPFVALLGSQILQARSSDTDEAAATKAPNIFISYCRRDAEYLGRLKVHLKPLQRAGQIDEWDDTRLRAGDMWRSEIASALSRASCAVLLVSADYLASDFIAANELPPLLAKAAAEGTRIIPVVLKPCGFARDPHLAEFHAINDPRRPLISLDEAGQEAIYDNVATEIETYAKSRR